MNDGSFRAVVLAKSINFDLMSTTEQEAVEYAYQGFLNSLYFDIQIFIRSRKIDMRPYLADCDLLMMETGHHHPAEVAAELRRNPDYKVKELLFLHHGRRFLDHYEETCRQTEEAWGSLPIIAEDGMSIDLN